MKSDVFTAAGEFWARALPMWTSDATARAIPVIVAIALVLVALRLGWKLGSGTRRPNPSNARPVLDRLTTGREVGVEWPLVATSWRLGPRIHLRRALAEAHRLAGPDALRILVVAGDGTHDLCHSIGLAPPGDGTVRIAAGNRTVLIDAAGADSRTLRQLASALPRRRPIDAAAAIVTADGVPPGTLARMADVSRATGFRVALHFVIAGSSRMAAWRIVDAGNRDGRTLCAQLAREASCRWLAGGSRAGLSDISNAGSRGLPEALNAAFAAATPRFVDVASLCFTGEGLRAAAAQTAVRTRPMGAPRIATWASLAVLLVGAWLTGLVAVTETARSDALRVDVESSAQAAATPMHDTDVDAASSGRAIRRTAELGVRLAGYSEFSPLLPLASVLPHYDAPGRLGALLLDVHALRPLARELDRHSREHLTETDDPAAFLENARLIGKRLAAWEGLADNPQGVDLRSLFSDAFGGGPDAWPEGMGRTLARSGSKPPQAYGVLDSIALTALAHRGFVAAMRQRAHDTYTNGPVARAARRAGLTNSGWRERHDGLRDLRAALHDPGQSWLIEARHRPSNDFELQLFGGALTLSLLARAGVAEARAVVDRIRTGAREAAEQFTVAEIGRLLVRSDASTQHGGSAFALTPRAKAWLEFLDRIRSTGILDLRQAATHPGAGPVTVDQAPLAETRAMLRTFDRSAAGLLDSMPPESAQSLLLGLANEMADGVAAEVEHAVRTTDRGPWLTVPKSAFDDLTQIETWLRESHSADAANRVLRVRSRVAGTLLESAALGLMEEDPLGIRLETFSDATAPFRQFEQGVERLQSVYDLIAAPYIAVAERGGESSAYDWLEIGEDISRYRSGDSDAALSGLEHILRVYADDPPSICAAGPMPRTAAQSTYVEQAVSRVSSDVARTCSTLAMSRNQATYDSLVDYFKRHVSPLWPYAGEPNAPEISVATLGQFVERVHAARGALETVEGPLVEPLLANVRFWTPGADGGAAVRFRVDWRARREEERLAHHVAEIGLAGVERDADGIHTWHYGQQAALRMRLAANSPYRFVRASDPMGLEYTLVGHGNGSLLRILEGLHEGALTIETEVVDSRNARWPLRVTARVTYVDGVPISLRRTGVEHLDSYVSELNVVRG